MHVELAGYTGCQRRGKPVIHPPPHARCDLPLPRLEPRRDGLVRTQQDHGRHPGHLPGPAVAEHRGQCDLPSRRSRPSPATTSRCPRSRSGDQKGAPAQQDPPIEQLLASADLGARRDVRTTSASPATPSTRAAATWSAPISTVSSAARRASVAGLQLFGRLQEDDERPLDRPGAQRLRQESEGHGSRHHHDLRRHHAGERARRPDRLPQQPSPTTRRP